MALSFGKLLAVTQKTVFWCLFESITNVVSGTNQSGLVLLLLGEKQSGKSSTGNIILGRQAFGKNTTHSSKATSIVFGKQV